MKIILSHDRRVGALPGELTTARRKPFITAPARVIAVFALAALGCAGHAQDETPTATAVAGAATTATATAAKGSAEGVSVVASNLPIERVLGQLGDQAGATISARGKTVGTKVTLISPIPMPLRDALNQLVNSQPNWLLYEPRDRPGTFEIWDQETYKAEVLPRLVRPKVFLPQNITAEEAAAALEGIMTPGIGRVAADQRSNKVIMTDLVPVLELAQRLLETIDVKFLTRVYYIEHADVNEVAEKLSALKSPASPDVQVDERTRQIIVSDRIDILQKMEQLVETLDVGPEMRVYTINNLGVEGEELEELEIAIEEILTPDAYFHFNIRQGKLIIRDLPEVHERVEQVLAAFDAPVRQILLQLEIIETEFTEGFNWQVDYAFSGDLLAAVTDGLVSGVPTPPAAVPPTGGVAATPLVDGGFINFRKEFPVVQAGSNGLDATFLSSQAFFRLQTAMSDSRTRVLQQPRLLVENQKLASFNVGQSIPFFTGGSIGVSQNGVQNNLTPSQPVQQLLQVGLFVEVIPIISANGLVELEITVENSSPLRVEQTFGGLAYTGVGKTEQELSTTMWVPSGSTRVIGGLVADSKSESRSGIPGLIKIPIIGPALFGSYNKSPEDNRRRNLLIFVTPTIVEENLADPIKYKGAMMANLPQDALIPPPATLTDLPLQDGALSNITQLEKGDYLSYTPPPLPDFQSMTRTTTGEGSVLLSPMNGSAGSPPSLSGIDATVNIDDSIIGDVDSYQPVSSAVPPNASAAPSGLTALPRVTIQESMSTDTLSSLVTSTGPSGMLSTGSRNLGRPAGTRATATPAGNVPPATAAVQATEAAAAVGGIPGAPAPTPPAPASAPTVTTPSREINLR